jgi:hypothetical protein
LLCSFFCFFMITYFIIIKRQKDLFKTIYFPLMLIKWHRHTHKKGTFLISYYKYKNINFIHIFSVIY